MTAIQFNGRPWSRQSLKFYPRHPKSSWFGRQSTLRHGYRGATPVFALTAEDPAVHPGKIDIFSKREAKDYYNAIEWAAEQPWCSGKVGLNGISYYSITQWNVASLQPPHLTAMIPWEGASDMYRDVMRHGGILNNGFFDCWYYRQVVSVQAGNPDTWHDPWLNDRASGTEVLSAEDRERNRTEPLADIAARPLDDEWYRSRSADFSKIIVPFLSAANWGGYGIHPRGNFEAFTQAASKQKWLDCHPGRHEEWFYLEYGLSLQKRFFDHFLKDVDNGWDKEPPVMLNLRRPSSSVFEKRRELNWPLPHTEWTKFYLDSVGATVLSGLSTQKAPAWTRLNFAALGQPVRFLSKPFEKETEITGPMSAKIFASSTTTDMDLFLTFQAFHNDKEVVFEGVMGKCTALSVGWLRASHRKLDRAKTLPYRPYHSHDEIQPLQPGEIYELDIEILPTNIILPKGSQIALQIGGKDFERLMPSAGPDKPWKMANPALVVGHTHVMDRPKSIFGGETTVYTGGTTSSYVLVPVIKGH